MKTAINAWRRRLGRSGGTGVELVSDIVELAPADLDFQASSIRKIILSPGQGKVIIPHSIWAKIEYPTGGGGQLPTNLADLNIGLANATGNGIALGKIAQESWSTNFNVNSYIPVMASAGAFWETVFPNSQVSNIEAMALRIFASNADDPDPAQRLHGGNYTLKLRVVHEILEIQDFI